MTEYYYEDKPEYLYKIYHCVVCNKIAVSNIPLNATEEQEEEVDQRVADNMCDCYEPDIEYRYICKIEYDSIVYLNDKENIKN